MEAARLENSLIFQIDDKPIPGFDAPDNRTSAGISRAVTPGSSIALASRSKKRKREPEVYVGPSADAVLLINGIREATASLAGAFRDMAASQRSQLTNSTDAGILQPLEQRMDQMEASIERMTDAFQSSSTRDRSTTRDQLDEAPVIE